LEGIERSWLVPSSTLLLTRPSRRAGKGHESLRQVVYVRRERDLHRNIMIRFILVQNKQGKSRLAKFYVPYDDDEKTKLKGEVHRLVAPRDTRNQSNFVEVSYGRSPAGSLSPLTSSPHKLVPKSQDRLQAVCRSLLLRVHRRK
jgi:hypothetical protein